MLQWPILCLYQLCFCFIFASIGINGSSVTWSSWSDCSVTCGQGKQTRTKVCILGQGLCLPSLLVGTETQDCNSIACPTSSSLITAYSTYTAASYSVSFTENPTSMTSLSSYELPSTSSRTLSPTSSIISSQPTIVTHTPASYRVSFTENPLTSFTSSTSYVLPSTSSQQSSILASSIPASDPLPSYSVSFTENPLTFITSSTTYVLPSTSSPTVSPTSSIPASEPMGFYACYFALNHRGCRYSGARISRTIRVRSGFHCTSICARDSDCVAFNLDASLENEYLTCEILEKGYDSDVSLAQVSDDCKNYERVTI